ncbi:MAG: CPBP family intramembrane glutamic endopeptidase, partial [Candidatus Bathyarchaeia archaeon]
MTVEFKQVKNDVKITSTPWMRLIPTLKASFKYILLTASLTVAVSFFISHFLGLFLLLFTPEGLEVMSVPIKGVPVIIYPTPVVIPLEINVGSLFIILWTFQLSCLLIAITSREGVLTTVRNTLKGSVKSIFKSNIISTPLIANATLLTVLAIYTLQEAQGIPTGALPETNRYKFYFLLTQASIFEELTFRVFLIGVFEAVTTLHLYSLTHPNERKLKRSAIFLRALLFPHKTLESLGLKDVWRKERMGLTPEEWFILALSSVMFGSAHVLSGIGWEIGKVTHATLVGVVLGLMYMKFGFQASIILHWFFNNYF